jgi:CheY-like chemotaxis protein
VDDEAAECESANLLLRQLGYTPRACEDAGEALARFRACPKDYDVVITDLDMPKMTGPALATQILALRPDLPVYLMAGPGIEWTQEMARSLGFRAVLVKPLTAAVWSLTLLEALPRPV